jgi:hypothetical protein
MDWYWWVNFDWNMKDMATVTRRRQPTLPVLPVIPLFKYHSHSTIASNEVKMTWLIGFQCVVYHLTGLTKNTFTLLRLLFYIYHNKGIG